jgi:hypothetical protein
MAKTFRPYAQNSCSSPLVELTVGGKLDLYLPGSLPMLRFKKTISLPFQLDIRTELDVVTALTLPKTT